MNLWLKAKLNDKGFNLIELMIVVAIIGILVGIGVPKYANYIKRSRDNVAKTKIMEIRSAMESYKGMQRSFPSSLETLDQSIKINLTKIDSSNYKDSYYSYTISAVGTTDFTLTATSLDKKKTMYEKMTLNRNGDIIPQ